MSAVPPQAAEKRTLLEVRELPNAAVSKCSKDPLLDNLVGAREHSRGHAEAKRLCCLKVDDQFVLGRCLHRQVGGLLALENAIDIAGGKTVLVDSVRPVAD